MQCRRAVRAVRADDDLAPSLGHAMGIGAGLTSRARSEACGQPLGAWQILPPLPFATFCTELQRVAPPDRHAVPANPT
jgi:hypothetical protein